MDDKDLIFARRMAKEFKNNSDPSKRIDNAMVRQDPENPMNFYFLLFNIDFNDFRNGFYLGSMEITKEYPSKAPVYRMITPNGRFMNADTICTSDTHWHNENVNQSSLLLQKCAMFLTLWFVNDAGIGALFDSTEVRQKYASESFKWNIINKNKIFSLFIDELMERKILKAEHIKIMENYGNNNLINEETKEKVKKIEKEIKLAEKEVNQQKEDEYNFLLDE